MSQLIGQRSAANIASLHGESAAQRQAITELLFFAGKGDLLRCRKICHTWNIDPKDPGTADYDQRTPLHLASAEGSYAVAKWLLDECHVSANPVDRFHRTPLEEAVRGDNGEITSLLLSHGAKVMGREGALVDLSETPLSGPVRIFGELDPEWEVNPADLQMGPKLGEGEFGVVFKANYLGTSVAVKILKDMNAVSLGDFKTELNVLQKVHHPHTVQFLGAVTKSLPYMIITEFMGCGSMADVLRSGEVPSMRRGVQLALDCARAMAYLHNHSPLAIIHRDLKPANLMLSGQYIETEAQRRLMIHELGVLKIADFGLSKSLKLTKESTNEATATAAANGGPVVAHQGSAASYKLTGETGSYRYMAPEVFRHELYNHKVDQYAFAMICFQLFEGVAPFYSLDPVQAAMAASMHGLRPEWDVNKSGRSVPKVLRLLVERCWSPEAEQRPEFVEIISRLQTLLGQMPLETPFSGRGSGAGAGGGAGSGGGGDGGCCSVQ